MRKGSTGRHRIPLRIPLISITCSGGFRSPVPEDSDHRFRRIPITLVRRRSAAVLEARFMGLKSRGWRGSSSSAGAVAGGSRDRPRAVFRRGGGGAKGLGRPPRRSGRPTWLANGAVGPDRADLDGSGLAVADVRTAARPAESLLCVPSPPIGGREVPADACFGPGSSADQEPPGTARLSFVESYSRLIEAPLRSMRWALLTRRSRMASPKVGSPTTSCQCSTGTWLASSVPRRA